MNKNIHETVFENRFKEYYDLWVGKFKDDRGLFCNTYEMVSEALVIHKNTSNVFVKVAIMNSIEKEEKMLRGIIKRFKEMKLI